MFFTNYFLGMDFIWWIIWSVLLVWIFLVPYDIPGQRNRKRSAMDILQERFAGGAIVSRNTNATKKYWNVIKWTHHDEVHQF